MHAVIADNLVLENKLVEGCLVRIERYVCSELAGGIKVAVIAQLKVEGNLKALKKIGCPTRVQETASSTPTLGCRSEEQRKEVQQQEAEVEEERGRKSKDIQESYQVIDPSDPRDRRGHVAVLGLKRKRKVGTNGVQEASKLTRHSEVELSIRKSLCAWPPRPYQKERDLNKLIAEVPSKSKMKKRSLSKQGKVLEPPAPALQVEASRLRSIRFISPYLRHWELKGRCTFKGELYEFHNRKGKGVLFSFQLTDNTGSIDITAFTELAKVLFERIRLNHVYFVSKGYLRPAHSKYNRSTSFYEMSLDENSLVREAPDDGSIAASEHRFVKIRDLLRARPNSYVDVLGVVEEISEVERIYLRSSGEEVMKRTITILDDSEASVSLTLWKNKVNVLKTGEERLGKVLMLHGARRSYYNGIKLSVGSHTVLTVNPDMDEAARLRTWYLRRSGALGRSQFVSSILKLTRLESPLNKARTTLMMGKEKLSHIAFGPGTQKTNGIAKKNNAYMSSFTTRGMIAEFRQDIMMSYPSDPITKKKIEEVAPGVWYSSSSSRNLDENMVKLRYALWVRVVDETGDAWMCAFDEAAKVFLGLSADEMEKLKKNNHSKWERIFYDACFRPLIMEIVCKPKRFRGQEQLHYVMNCVEYVNFAKEGRVLLNEIKSFLCPSGHLH